MKMKLYFLSHSVSMLMFFNAVAQPGEWTWIHGSNTANAIENLGVQGIPAGTNVPAAIYEACEFKDLNGNFWMYGGVRSFGSDNNLWKYDPITNEWTWMTGTNTLNDAGVFGTQGVSSPANRPPSLGYAAASWTDLNGNFWMFGGYCLGEMNALWKYDVGINEWTWMKGDNLPGGVGVYGTQGVPGILNTPGSRMETSCTWTDNAGDLWLFGGTTAGLNNNDLWRYHIATSEWTWMKGSQTPNQTGVYGVLGVEDPANTPGCRQVYSRWKDGGGNLWLFGGGDYPTNIYFNDMWRYNPATNNWSWKNGSNIANPPGDYGTLCTPATSNVPPPRFESRGSCTDPGGNFWMFGGGTGGGAIPQVWNDLWKYCPATNEWTWIDNDATVNPAGNWGTLGVTAPTNKPNGRSGNLLWSDNSGHLYAFGGTTFNYNTPFQDMWKYNIDPACAPCSNVPIALFNAPNHICPGTCTNFNNLSINATSFLWIFQGATPGTSTDIDPQNICYNTPGQYDVMLIANNPNGSDTLNLINFITVYPYPAPQGITQSGDTLFANSGAVSYQWYYNGSIIPGATNDFYVATVSGDYNVVATDINNCEVEAAIFDVIAGLTPALSQGEGVTAFPNPAKDKLTIINRQYAINAISIYNILGEIIMVANPSPMLNNPYTQIDISALTEGMYWIEFNAGGKMLRAKFIKE